MDLKRWLGAVAALTGERYAAQSSNANHNKG
jgi:hypothetical protein